MKRSELESGIVRSWDFLVELGLAETFSNPGSLEVDSEFRNVVLRSDARHGEIYFAGLKFQCYNILLSDYSYLQYSWEKEDHFRYAFYPNPFISKSHEAERNFAKKRKLVQEGALTEEEWLALLATDENEGYIPILRYENSPGQYRGFAHPCSHLHIGTHGENRWAFQRILSPLAFSMLVVKQYYSEEWAVHGENAEDRDFRNRFERDLVEEKEGQCRILHRDHFSEFEERSFVIR